MSLKRGTGRACEADLARLEQQRKALWAKPMAPGYKPRIKDAAEAAHARLAKPAASESAKSVDAWSETLAAQETLEALEEAWGACREQFSGNPPTDCDAAYTFRKEQLESGEDLDL